MDKDGNVISVKSLEDLFEDFVELEGVSIKVEYINKIDRQIDQLRGRYYG